MTSSSLADFTTGEYLSSDTPSEEAIVFLMLGEREDIEQFLSVYFNRRYSSVDAYGLKKFTITEPVKRKVEIHVQT